MLVPTRELAVQVAEVLEPLAESTGRRVVVVYGGADIERQIKKLHKGVDVVIATPGRLIDLTERRAVSVAEVEVVVLDEADRMADMGFLPQVDWVLRRIEGRHQTMLFSATLDGDVDRLVRRHLTDPVRHEVASAMATVESMEHRFLQVHQMDKVKVAASICRGATKALVFVRTKRGADRLVEQLQREGVRAAAIHGDLRQSSREKALEDFTAGRLPVLVATDVAARGLDIDDVDVVVHYDPPEDHKAYLHRSGRTARAGGLGCRRHPGPVGPDPRRRAHPEAPGPAGPHRRDLLQRSPPGRPGRLAARQGRRLSVGPPGPGRHRSRRVRHPLCPRRPRHPLRQEL